MVARFLTLRRFRHHLGICRIQHILNKNAVSRGGIVYEDVRDRADELAVLDNGASAHECVQVGTTVFIKKLKSQNKF